MRAFDFSNIDKDNPDMPFWMVVTSLVIAGMAKSRKPLWLLKLEIVAALLFTPMVGVSMLAAEPSHFEASLLYSSVGYLLAGLYPLFIGMACLLKVYHPEFWALVAMVRAVDRQVGIVLPETQK